MNDAETGGLTGRPAPRRSPESLHAARPWSPAEDLLAFAAAARAGSERHYRQMIVTLLETLGRTPERTKSQPDVLAGAVKLFEWRTVTNAPAGLPFDPAAMALARTVWAGGRAGCRLTWGEKLKILQPLYRQHKSGRPTKTLGDVAWLTDRDAGDIEMFRAYWDRLKGNPKSKADLEDDSGPVFVHPAPVVRDRVVGPWIETPNRSTWAVVFDYLWNGLLPPPPPTLVGDDEPGVIAAGPSYLPPPVDPDDGLPDVYMPTSLRPPPPKPWELAFAVGAENRSGSYGMFGGPWPTVAEALEFVPTGHVPGRRSVFLFRFNPDHTDDRLYLWDEPNGHWVRFRG